MDAMTGTLGDTVRKTSSDETVSETVITAVADAKGVSPLDLDPLYESIDPDALDRLFEHADGESSITQLSFEMADCKVIVRGNGEVTVAPVPTASEGIDRVISLE